MNANRWFVAIALLMYGLFLATDSSFAAKGGKPPPPPPDDPCTTPSVVDEATFPSFIFARNITVKNGPYTIGTFLADATGKCERLISTSWPGPQRVNMRYDADTNLVLVVADGLLNAGMWRVAFDESGPSVSLLMSPMALLDPADLVTPVDLTGWTNGGHSEPRISPDGTQVLFHRDYRNEDLTPTGSLDTFWTCDLIYDDSKIIQPIVPLSCAEVHRAPVNDNNNWGSHARWGAKDETIYVVEPSSFDPSQFSLNRLTLPTTELPGAFEEIFRNGRVFDDVRATATADENVPSGELVAVYEIAGPSPDICSTVIVIDAYACNDTGTGYGSCTILNNQGLGNGLFSLTWLPDGRVAGDGQLPPGRGYKGCYHTGTLEAFPAIDPNATPATVLTTGRYFEGAEGGW